MSVRGWRALLATAIRTALDTGLTRAEDPAAYLASAHEELGILAEDLAAHDLADDDERRELQVVVVQEITQAIGEALKRMRH